jgi:cation transport ATPase
LVRDPAALEALARTRLVAFDKAGTLTSGRARLVAIESKGAEVDEVLASFCRGTHISVRGALIFHDKIGVFAYHRL